uniref:Uncharacterized protein n=1 Tax=Meloidogyne enterolobii TaxID=390850 RepID=A0A6V7VY05_MELEN|nr:unnamed protein product [Meloidogyne enterolobii]
MEEIWPHILLKFSKFSPAAQEKGEFWLLGLQNSQNFRLRRLKRKNSGLESSKILKIFACGAGKGRILAS